MGKADSTRDVRAAALINKANRSQWVGAGPDPSIGFTMSASSWPERDALNATTRIRLWRNPDPSMGDLWHQTARFGTIREWQPKKASGWFIHDFFRQLKQLELDFAAARTPIYIPWGTDWSGAGGTTDNGLIIKLPNNEEYEILGLAPLGPLGALAVNGRCLASVADENDWRVDSIQHRRTDTKPVGAQGPAWRSDGLLRPDHLQRLVPGTLRLVVFNTQWGPNAKHAPGGWIEHKGTTQPYGLPGVTTPAGDHPDMLPNYQPFAFHITDLQIEQWISSERTPANLVEPRRWFARNMRGYTLDSDKPATPQPTLRVCVSGTGNKILESTGGTVPLERARWAAQGVVSEEIARSFGRNIFNFGRLESL